MMLSFIPRLVVHKDEINRIFFPEESRVFRSKSSTKETKKCHHHCATTTLKLPISLPISNNSSAPGRKSTIIEHKFPINGVAAVSSAEIKTNIISNNNNDDAELPLPGKKDQGLDTNVVESNTENLTQNCVYGNIVQFTTFIPAAFFQAASTPLRFLLSKATTVTCANSSAKMDTVEEIDIEQQCHQIKTGDEQIDEEGTPCTANQVDPSIITADVDHVDSATSASPEAGAPVNFSDSKILQLALEVPVAIFHFASEIVPVTLANISTQIQVPSITITKVQALATDVPVSIVQLTSDVAREVVQLPHRASHNWKELIWVLFLLVFCTVAICGVVFFIPLSAAYAGLDSNRNFLYGVMTYYQLLALIPWIETCNFAMPTAKVPVKARILTLIVALAMQKAADAMIAERWWFKRHAIFPIPFSIIVSGMIGFVFVVPMIKRMTPNNENFQFRKMLRVLCVYWFSLLVVGCWAIGMRRLAGRMTLQMFWGSMYGPLRFICKILISAPLTTKLSPRRWIVLNMVVDILFTRVQIATYPYIDNYLTVILLCSTELLTLAWRYYGGVDRLALWWSVIWSKVIRTRIRGSIRKGQKIIRCIRIQKKRRKTTTKKEGQKKEGRQQVEAPGQESTIATDGIENYSESDNSDGVILPCRSCCNDVDSEVLSSSSSSSSSSLAISISTSSSSSEASYSNTSIIQHEFGNTVKDITAGCLRAPIPHIAQLNMRLREIEKVHRKAATAHANTATYQQEDLCGNFVVENVNKEECGEDTEATFSPVETSANDNYLSSLETKDWDDTQENEGKQAHQPTSTVSISVLPSGGVQEACALADLRDYCCLSEEHWEQRPLYHVIDSVGSTMVSIIVRINQQLSISLARVLPGANHLKESFEINAEIWKQAQIYDWLLIVFMFLLLASLEVIFFKRQLQKLQEEGRQLTLSRIMCYIYRDHFWFFFHWLLATGAYSSATMIDHFGADFTLEFSWIRCGGLANTTAFGIDPAATNDEWSGCDT